jgi:phage/plasmid-like protein (TIGR03299 family)
MAHDLALTAGRVSHAYVGQTPWHGLGQSLTVGADLDTWVRESGLTYHIGSSPIGFYPNAVEGNLGDVKPLGGRVALFRDDTSEALSIVSGNYKLVQPAQVMEFFRDLSSDNKLQMETAGALKGGAIYWALARVSDSFAVGKGDDILPYVLLATSCDGSLATTASFTTIRVVCQNTLSWALQAKGNTTGKVKIPHNSVFDESAVKRDMGLIDGSWADFQAKSKLLAKRQVTQKELIQFMVQVFADEAKGNAVLEHDDVEAQLKSLPSVVKAMETYQMGVGQSAKSAKGTAFGLVNAITRYTDFEVKSITDESRLRSAWFGAGARRKAKAVKLAVELI